MNNQIMNKIFTIGLSLLSGYLSYSLYVCNKDKNKDEDKKLIILNSWPFHDEVLKYLCEKYG